ncbi:unnamed protein product, partial [Symbiodinium pilosum]
MSEDGTLDITDASESSRTSKQLEELSISSPNLEHVNQHIMQKFESLEAHAAIESLKGEMEVLRQMRALGYGGLRIYHEALKLTEPCREEGKLLARSGALA